MKNKRLIFVIIGLFITLACLLAMNVLFPAAKVEKVKVLLTRDSTLNSYFANDDLRIIADSERAPYEIEEKDIKTDDELNKDREEKKTYTKTDFVYNIDNNELEIVKYKGNSLNLIIPMKIDGYTVVKVNLTELQDVESIFIPNTVTTIVGEFAHDIVDKNLAMANMLVIIAFVIYTIVIVTLSNKNLEENFYNSTTYIFSIVYLILSLALCLGSRMIGVSLRIFYVTYDVIVLIYILLVILMRFYKNRLLNNK